MAVGRSRADASALTDHHSCRLGKWYAAARERFDNVPAFRAIEPPHCEVHNCGIAAAKCFAANRLDEGMAHYRKLDAASAQVLRLLDELLRHATSRAE
jgi:methyl-accepting chemotaxis protein